MSETGFKRRYASSDLVAGLTFAVVNIPQAMAQALLAAVNPVVGIYTLMIAVPVGAIFTSSVFMNVSPTSALSVAVGSIMVNYSNENRLQALATLVLMVGAFQIVLGLLKMGSLIRFVPHSVMVGFINGVAVLIILGQLSDLTAYNSPYSNRVAKSLDLFLHFDHINWETLLVGLLTILVIVGINQTRLRKISAIFGLVIASVFVAVASSINYNWNTVVLVQNVAHLPGALPHPQLPKLSFMVALIIPAISIAIVGLVQGAGVSQSYPNSDGKFPDLSRDFFGQGMANLATSFFQGIPAGGSMSGTTLNTTSGAKTRWTNIFAGIFTAFIILIFSGLVGVIPMAALAGLVLLAGVQSLRIPEAIMVAQTGAISAVAMAITFVGTLIIPLQYAVLLGVAFSILLYVIRASNQVKVVQIVLVESGLPEEAPAPAQLSSDQVTLLMIYGSIFFASSKMIEDMLPALDQTRHAVVILRLRGHYEVGSTFIGVLSQYAEALKKCESKLMLTGISDEVHDRLRRTGCLALIGEENIFLATTKFVASTNSALAAAHAWLDGGISMNNGGDIRKIDFGSQ